MENTEIVVNSSSKYLDEKSNDIIAKVVPEESPDELKKLISMFNMTQSKKNLIRADMFSKLIDKISEQMTIRMEKRPGEFSNKDLLDYLNAAKSMAAKSTELEEAVVNTPVIVQNNTQVNINNTELTKESRERVADAVKAILSSIDLSSVDDLENLVEIDD